MQVPTLDILLPVGISFYTFQALGYTIDVYRGNTKAERNFLTYALFVSFFPQLVAGPIERSTNLLNQFKLKFTFDGKRAMQGFKLMLWGYFLKLVVADRCAMYVDPVFNNLADKEHSPLMASILFCFQVYGDFSGYTFIAIGCAMIMGFQLMENFRRPYFATSVTDFWHRWHISLSTWFKDYLYIPLGGNRVGKWRGYFNVLITFIISGIWHGANWTFIIWGTIHGLLQCIERHIGWGKRQFKGLSKILHIVLTFSIVCFAWIFFRAANIEEAFRIIQMIFSSDITPFNIESTYIFIIGIVILKEFMEEKTKTFSLYEKHKTFFDNAYMIFLLVMIMQIGVTNGGKFIYFQF